MAKKQPATPHDELRVQAVTALKSAEFVQAAELFGRLVAVAAPDDDSRKTMSDRANLATSLLRLGRNQDAADVLETVVALRPGDEATHSKLGRVWSRLGETQRALIHIRRVTEIAPGSAENQWELARALHDAGEAEEATAALNACLAIDPDHAAAKAAHRAWSEDAPTAAQAPTDAAFASVANFIQERALANSGVIPKPKTEAGIKPLLAVTVGAFGFLGLYLFVRIIVLGG